MKPQNLGLQLCTFIFMILAASKIEAQKTYAHWEGLGGKVKTVTTENVTYVEKFGKWEEDSRTMESVERYDENGAIEEQQNFADGNPSVKFVYDNDDRLPKTSSQYGPDGADAGRTDYAWNNGGSPVEITSYDENGAITIKLVATYDSNNHIVSAEDYDGNGKLTGKSLFIWDEKKRVREERDYDSQGKLSGRQKSEWSSKDRLAQETYYEADGSVRWIATYEYDSIGNWIKRTAQNEVSKFGKRYLEPQSAEIRTIEYFE